MQSQVKIFCCLALFSLTLLGSDVKNGEQLGWSAIKSEKIEITDYSSAQGEVISSYLPYFNDIGSALWRWDPKSESEAELKKGSIREPHNMIDEMMKNLFIDFNVSDTKNFRKVWFRPKKDLMFRGLFGIHDFSKPRPLIILRMGIHGNVDEFLAERFLAKLVYEDLDANILILESLTSHAFLSKNKAVSFGGIDEGIFTFFVVNELDNSPLKKIIQSYHLLSISMGAHGTFVTAILDQANGEKIKSILNFCPLINLKETFDLHAGQGLKQTAIDLWNTRRLSALFTTYPNRPELKNWWESIFDLKPRFTNSVMKILNSERKQPLLNTTDLKTLIPSMKWPEEFKKHLEESKSFDELNNFWPYYRNIKIPMTIYTTPNDPLVPNELNSEKIFSSQQPGDYKNLKFQRLERGVHCGLAPVYNWDYLIQLVKKGLEL